VAHPSGIGTARARVQRGRSERAARLSGGLPQGDSFEAIYFPAARASSVLTGSGANRYGVKQLQDGDVSTAWVEGAKGDGVGAWLEFTFDRATGDAGKVRDTGVAVTSIDIMNGYRKSAKTWAANGRVREFDMYANGKQIARLRLADNLRVQNVKVPRIVLPLGKRRSSARHHRVYRGRDFPDTAISELEFVGEGVF
jgi:hypothetical protein